MKWKDIRSRYPNRWLLLEALEARSEADKRLLEQIAVVDSFTDSETALKSYQDLHRQSPERELYVFHTDRNQLDITERRWLGVRSAR